MLLFDKQGKSGDSSRKSVRDTNSGEDFSLQHPLAIRNQRAYWGKHGADTQVRPYFRRAEAVETANYLFGAEGDDGIEFGGADGGIDSENEGDH